MVTTYITYAILCIFAHFGAWLTKQLYTYLESKKIIESYLLFEVFLVGVMILSIIGVCAFSLLAFNHNPYKY